MFKFSDLKQIHLEITNNCQASCPMCARNIRGGLDNPLLQINSWSLDNFKTIISKEVLDQVELLYFCGNFGDPILNNDLIEMCEYVAVNSNVSVNIHTNGGARNTDWWSHLAKTLPTNHRVIFAIDGLEDTHSIYRIGTTFHKVIENAQAFINAGGNAEWAFIRFKHNEHQSNEAKELATKLGFKNFTLKDSSRFFGTDPYPVFDKQGSMLYNLEPSTYSEIKFIDSNVIKEHKKIVAESEIHCQVLEFKEVYIDAFGRLFPCCWTASTPYTYFDDDIRFAPVRKQMLKEYDELIAEFGGIDNLDAIQRTVKEIINSNEYQSVWYKFWQEKKLTVCARACGVLKTPVFSKPSEQYTSKEELTSVRN